MPENLKIVSIGPITSNTIREEGFEVDVEATQYDIPGLVDAVLNYCQEEKPQEVGV